MNPNTAFGQPRFTLAASTGKHATLAADATLRIFDGKSHCFLSLED
jgi:hypothetical protein